MVDAADAIVKAREAVEELPARQAWPGLLDLVLLEAPGDLGHGRDHGGNGESVRADRQLFVEKDVRQLQRVRLGERLLERPLRSEERRVGKEC